MFRDDFESLFDVDDLIRPNKTSKSLEGTMNNVLTSVVASFYMLESAFSVALDAGLVTVVRDDNGDFVGFVPKLSEGEDARVRQVSAVANFLKFRTRFVDTVADMYYTYLWYAAFGEARHAESHSSSPYPGAIPQGGSRSYAATYAVAFEPTEHNRQILHDTFDADWHGAYGGSAWANIVKAMDLYHVNKVVFVDFVHDLEHNTGTVFNKETAGRMANLSFDFDFGLNKFLNNKRDTPMYALPQYFEYCYSDVVRICNQIFKFGNVQTLPLRQCTLSSTFVLRPFELPEWGNRQLDEEGIIEARPVASCYNCDDDIYDYDETITVDGYTWCEYCVEHSADYCEYCNEYTSYNFNHDYGMCEDCKSDNFSECDHCQGEWHNDDFGGYETPNGYQDLCPDCANELTKCTKCETPLWESDVAYVYNAVSQIDLCTDCHKELEAIGYNENQLTLEL